MMFQGKIAAVSYLNSIPLIYGIERAKELQATLLLSPPNQCAKHFQSGEVDIALVPVGALADFDNYKIITSFCVGASSRVRTVTIMSHVPIDQVEHLWLDSHSRSSVMLAKILCAERWGITPRFSDLIDYSVVGSSTENDAFVLIGDKVFEYEGIFEYVYDLAYEWQEHTALPMVFAVWIARKELVDSVESLLQSALAYGVTHIQEAIEYYGYGDREYAYEYLTENVDFVYDHAKQKGLQKFLESSLRYRRTIHPG